MALRLKLQNAMPLAGVPVYTLFLLASLLAPM